MSTLNLGKDNLILDSDYSTEEKPTGATWIDGKPIYRKVISTTTPTFTANNIVAKVIDSTFTPSNSMIISVKGTAIMGGSQANTIPFCYPYVSGGNAYIAQIMDFYVGGDGLRMFGLFQISPEAFSNLPLYVTVEYIKL